MRTALDRLGGPGRRALSGLSLALSLVALGGCGDVLSVDLPSELTDGVLSDPVGATMQMNTVIANYETAYNDLLWQLWGAEDGGVIQIASGGDNFRYGFTPGFTWFNDFSRARSFASRLHDKLEKDWTVAQVADRSKYLAMTSLYAGAVFNTLAMTMCEATVDAGPLLKPADLHARADQLLTRAITEIGTLPGGDFAMPFGIAPSALNMAYGLRAQNRWMSGDKTGALADAARIQRGFYAYVTRDATPGRRNRLYYDGTFTRVADVSDVVDWWVGNPNPVTGQPFANPIPFTGWRFLGILPDGRAVRDDGLPIRTAGNHRTPIESTAVADTRTKILPAQIQSLGPGYVYDKYKTEGESIPLVNWREMWLIRAEIEGGQRAIDLVNEIRTADNLPRVTYADATNATQIKYMIIEERRRSMFVEGRYYATKIKNPDLLWFPRAQGQYPKSIRSFSGGVRFVMPENEYQLNTNLSVADQATGCDAATRPILR